MASPDQGIKFSNMKESEEITKGIRIQVKPHYSEEHSNQDDHEYVFSYQIKIQNESNQKVKLHSRKWIIINGDGHREDVSGSGVVGQTPNINPGDFFEYTSFCRLTTSWGTMEGSYEMHTEDDGFFDAKVGRFYLSIPVLSNLALK
jgi:ApaG protein